MGGYEDNDAVVDHIWNNFMTDENVVDNVLNLVDHGDVQRVQQVPYIHTDWLNEQEMTKRDKDAIHREVLRRLTMERAEGKKH